MTLDPPSRYSNPFATCWTKPGALAFQFGDGASAERLVERLRNHDWWGEVVGPHGAGKSTLLAALEPALATQRTLHPIALHDGQHRLPRGFLRRALSSPAALVIVDGYEQLRWSDRTLLRWRCRRAGAGLLVTAHQPVGLPAFISLQPDLALVEQLVAVLSTHTVTPVSPSDVAASFAGHGSNVREVFFALYDRHEQLRRTAAGCGT